MQLIGILPIIYNADITLSIQSLPIKSCQIDDCFRFLVWYCHWFFLPKLEIDDIWTYNDYKQIKISVYMSIFASKLIIGLKLVIAKLNSYPVRAVNAKWVYVFLLLFSLSKRSMKSKSLFGDYTYSLYGKTVLLRPIKDFQLIPSYHNDQLILIEWISPLAAPKIFHFLSFHRPYI